MSIVKREGEIQLLRAHRKGSGFGGEGDHIDADAIVRLAEHPREAYGLQLREDAGGIAQRAMFDLLRGAFTVMQPVELEVDLADGRRNGMLVRVTVRPAPARPPNGRLGTPVVVAPIDVGVTRS